VQIEQQTLLVEDRNGIRTVTLNRPESLNAINYDILDELEQVSRDSHYNGDVRVLVLKGAGRAFCAGDDLKGMGTSRTPLPEDAMKRADLGYPRFILALRRMAKPVIAHVHGFALGAGCDLALSCDLVFAAEDTQFGLVFAKRGMLSGTVLLPSLVGYQRACEILFSGETFSAQEALRLGLVNKVGPADGIRRTVDEWAERLAASPTAAIGMMKKAINQSIGLSLETAVDIQRYTVALSYHTHDYDEGKQAFVEKRAPKFTGT
jgi:2-(1,2-epoxy-1,2-dihydrophenyl)acetyl-CoA isomerase